MNKYLFLMSFGFALSCASFNSPFKGRVISSVQDEDIAVQEREGYIYVKTRYHLAQAYQGLHAVEIPLDLSFESHTNESMFGSQGYSFTLSGDGVKCNDLSTYQRISNLIMEKEYDVPLMSRMSKKTISCINKKNTDNSFVDITYKIKKNEYVDLENLTQSQLEGNDQTSSLSAHVDHFFENHIKYLSDPSVYSDHPLIHRNVGKKEISILDTSKTGYQFKKHLKKNEGIFIHAPSGRALIQSTGYVNSRGTTSLKTNDLYLAPEKKAYVVVCKVTEKDGSVYNYDFGNYVIDKLVFHNEEKISCGINSPQQANIIASNKGYYWLKTSILSEEYVQSEFDKAKSEPQKYLDNLIRLSNEANINIVKDRFTQISSLYQEKIQSERDISTIAPARKFVQTKAGLVTIFLKPKRVKVIHESNGLYFLDYDVHSIEHHYAKKTFNTYTNKLSEGTLIDMEKSLGITIKTNIKASGLYRFRNLKTLSVTLKHRDQSDFIEKLEEASTKKFITKNELNSLVDIQDAVEEEGESRPVQIIETHRSGLKVCATLYHYVKELERGSVKKGLISFHSTKNFYNNPNQIDKMEKFIFRKNLTDNTNIKTDRDYDDFSKREYCFDVSSKDLAERNFQQFVEQFK